ncbi:PREDICTED: U2 small nuclear ribonucleoprotein A' [Miniopterus natalensis]|uniref:U2 small nuclear ribonucleoprotein A' n=1 Tax=Miniopterus natalensis TaxID=291302 RepID=UPI0007A6E38C|nr:PREDICTED: U2 small nuclear ribonucleoprotein A' [Miniopterus natalensis]
MKSCLLADAHYQLLSNIVLKIPAKPAGREDVTFSLTSDTNGWDRGPSRLQMRPGKAAGTRGTPAEARADRRDLCGFICHLFTGYKIPVIENLGATLDQFDAIDFSDNEIRKLDGFPLLRRLKTLLVNNNRICRIGEGLDQALPCLTELILTNNSLVELGDLDPLASLKSLTYLSILRNPVTNKKHYRLYVIYKVPQVRVLDFQKVKLKERQEAEKMFKGKRGAQLAKDIARRSKTFNPGAGLPTDKKKGGPSPGDVEAIKNAIANASTLAEVERLKGLLQSGQIPGRERRAGPTNDGEEEMEEDTVTNGS